MTASSKWQWWVLVPIPAPHFLCQFLFQVVPQSLARGGWWEAGGAALHSGSPYILLRRVVGGCILCSFLLKSRLNNQELSTFLLIGSITFPPDLTKNLLAQIKFLSPLRKLIIKSLGKLLHQSNLILSWEITNQILYLLREVLPE